MLIERIINAISFFNLVVGAIFLVCYFYQFVYVIIPFVKKPKPHKEEVIHNIAILISARNERNVIGQLLDSIDAQNYPKDHLRVFIVADNCTDDTAQISRDRGAIVYERNNLEQVGKGYALDFLLGNIDRDYGLDCIDAFIVLDADNILDPGYVRAMNQTYCDGYKVTTSYRNSKNYDDNWLSAAYALWFMREARFLNNSRCLLGSSCAVSGTGFLFARELIQKFGGWKYFLLTEDIEFTVNCIVAGEKVGYCEEAVLYDEQPITFKQSWTQRLRWSKGFLQVWSKYGKKLWNGIVEGSYSCFDMTMTVCPAYLVSVLSIIFDVIGVILCLVTGNVHLIGGLVALIIGAIVQAYLLFFVMALLTLITEWKRIHCKGYKKIMYLFSFPIFLITYMPIALVALFKKVEWKPIVHTRSVTVDDIVNKDSDKNENAESVDAK